MKTTKRISVLLPVLNGQRTFNLALRSTLRALGPDDEVLVLIQGQNTEEYALDKIQDQRVSFFFADEPLGISKALNFLGEKAQGEFIARMDHDDICLGSRFNNQLKALRTNGFDFVFSNAVLFGRQIKPIGVLPQLPYSLKPEFTRLFLTIANPLVHPTMLARKSAIAALGFYRDCIAEDYDLWLRAAIGGYKIGKLSHYGLLYRVHRKQLSQVENFASRVAGDELVNESKHRLIQILVDEGEIDAAKPLEHQIWAKLRSANNMLKVVFSSAVKSVSRRAGSLLMKSR